MPSAGTRQISAHHFGWPAFLAVVVLVGLPPQWIVAQAPTQNVLAGSRIFGARGCVKCHAINGLGGVTGPDLARSEHRQSFYDFAAAMWNHLPGMAAQMRALGIDRPHLDPWETGDLIAFLFWLDYFDPPGDAENGQRLFSVKGCVGCHQIGGVGGVRGPNLDFLRQYGSPIEVAAAMWNHGSGMTATMQALGMRRPTFTGSELTDLITFLKTTARRPPAGAVSVLPGRADEGGKLFIDKQCIECHRADGQGGNLGPNLVQAGRNRSITEFAAAMWNKAPAMTAAMRSRGISVPQLRADDMADIVAYLYSLRYFGTAGRPERGRSVLQRKDCLSCHSLSGQGGSSASNLANVRTLSDATAVTAAMWNHVVITGDTTAGDMATWPTINAGEMADIAAYFQSLARSR